VVFTLPNSENPKFEGPVKIYLFSFFFVFLFFLFFSSSFFSLPRPFTQPSSFQRKMDPTEMCAFCKKPLSDPKTLPCLHSLCTTCIETLVQQDNDAKKTKDTKKKNTKGSKPSSEPSEPAEADKGLCCSQCSTAFVIPAGGVAALPADSYVLGLAKKKETASSVNPNDVQCACETEPAAVHCASCDAFIGDNCLKLHSKFKASAAHVVMKVDDYFKGTGSATRILFCQHHPALEIDTFCQTDDQPMCMGCIVPAHNSHNLVKLKDISLDFSAEITKALQPVRNLFPSLFVFSLSKINPF